MRKSIIVAASENGVIGVDGKLPWRLSDDLKRFKRLTMGHYLIMGRKTFESIGRPLPGRISMVLTRELFKDLHPEVWRMHGIDSAFAHASAAGEKEAFVCGGGEVYREALAYGCDRIYLTVVEREFKGDTMFDFKAVLKSTDGDTWKLTDLEINRDCELPHRFEVWDCIRGDS